MVVWLINARRRIFYEEASGARKAFAEPAPQLPCFARSTARCPIGEDGTTIFGVGVEKEAEVLPEWLIAARPAEIRSGI